MALSDIFTVPFLISLGITLLLVGLVGVFFVQRLQEQNHKIASMFGLVTTMAEEMNFIRGRLQMMSYQGSFPQGVQPQVNLADPSGLIPVSDGENDDDESDEDIDDSDDESDDEDEDDSENDDEESNNIIELSDEPTNTVKVINFDELMNSQEEAEELDNNSEELGELDELDDLEDDGKESEDEDDEEEQEKTIKNSDLEFIKTIDISNLEEPSDKNNVDYKKMSLNKLKEIAVAKGLINENSKATKNAILKLLGSE